MKFALAILLLPALTQLTAVAANRSCHKPVNKLMTITI